LASEAYVAALKLLARRELSEVQVRQRLARRGHDEDAIDDAVARLRQERAIDDDRVAAAIARTQTTIRRHGRLRVRREIERAGISAAAARRATDEVFGGLDADALLEASLTRRLRGRSIADDAELRRLYRYLVGQGFETEQVMTALKRRRKIG
jgi:regulatory protein